MSHSFKNNLFGAYYVPSIVPGAVGMKYMPWAAKSRERELMTYHKTIFPLYHVFTFNVHN